MALPDRIARRVGAGPHHVDGRRIDSRTRLLLRGVRADPRAVGDQSVDEHRRTFEALCAADALAGPRWEATVTQHRLPGGLEIRTWRAAEAQPTAAILWLHGGGWVLGGLDTHDRACRRLASTSGAIVAAVDYRRAPEHPFPAALEDALTAWAWLRDQAPAWGVDASRLAIGGDSAGGNLAAAACLLLPTEARPALQLLVYPGLDATLSHPSHSQFAEGFFLTSAHIRWFLEHYAQGHDRRDPRLSPLHASDLRGQPDALVVTASLDPLRDEGRAYAQRLLDCGAGVERIEVPTVHGFLGLCGCLPIAEVAVEAIGARVRAKLAAPGPAVEKSTADCARVRPQRGV